MPRIAIIGVSHPHVEYVLDELRNPDLGDFVVVGVQDREAELAQRYAAPFEVPVFSDAHDLLALKPDIAMIAGRYSDRGPDVVAALRSGAAVIADKPLCTSLTQLSGIERGVQESGKSVTLLLEKRGYPETIAALDVVQSGELGDIVGVSSMAPHKLNAAARPEWFFRPSEYGGILADLLVHDLDAALIFAPASNAVVRGWANAVEPSGFSRYGVASVVTPTTLITAEVSWLTPHASDVHGDYRMRVIGTLGSLEIFWARGRVEVVTDTVGSRDLDLPDARRPALDALLALAEGAPPGAETADAIGLTRLALLSQYSADHGGASFEWTRQPQLSQESSSIDLEE